MRITVQSARTLAASLSSAADSAEASGQADLDLLDTLAAVDDQARANLVAAIAEAEKS